MKHKWKKNQKYDYKCLTCGLEKKLLDRYDGRVGHYVDNFYWPEKDVYTNFITCDDFKLLKSEHDWVVIGLFDGVVQTLVCGDCKIVKHYDKYYYPDILGKEIKYTKCETFKNEIIIKDIIE
jgi:hypothetical protein